MRKPNVDEVLQQGIYGPMETKPEERRKFLGTLRERIIMALNKTQVGETEIYPQVEQFIKENPQAHLLLNGNIDYSELSKYVKLAAKYNLEHTIVTNKEHETEIGLVLVADHAIDKDVIFITNNEVAKPDPESKKNKGIFAKIFKR